MSLSVYGSSDSEDEETPTDHLLTRTHSQESFVTPSPRRVFSEGSPLSTPVSRLIADHTSEKTREEQHERDTNLSQSLTRSYESLDLEEEAFRPRSYSAGDRSHLAKMTEFGPPPSIPSPPGSLFSLSRTSPSSPHLSSSLTNLSYSWSSSANNPNIANHSINSNNNNQNGGNMPFRMRAGSTGLLRSNSPLSQPQSFSDKCSSPPSLKHKFGSKQSERIVPYEAGESYRQKRAAHLIQRQFETSLHPSPSPDGCSDDSLSSSLPFSYTNSLMPAGDLPSYAQSIAHRHGDDSPFRATPSQGLAAALRESLEDFPPPIRPYGHLPQRSAPGDEGHHAAPTLGSPRSFHEIRFPSE